MTKVEIIECERGWSKKRIDTLEFEEPNVAEAWVRGHNKHYNPADEPVPDYYIYARLQNQKNFGMLR